MADGRYEDCSVRLSFHALAPLLQRTMSARSSTSGRNSLPRKKMIRISGSSIGSTIDRSHSAHLRTRVSGLAIYEDAFA